MRDDPISDDELEREALAADPVTVLSHDAVSLWDLEQPGEADALLPGWYMPAPASGPRRHSHRQRRVVYLLVAAFAAINAAGLCSTYGHVVVA